MSKSEEWKKDLKKVPSTEINSNLINDIVEYIKLNKSK
jgi:hypothetical protein